jgi:pimeloyl-ACP methyl ester carboxylesterase
MSNTAVDVRPDSDADSVVREREGAPECPPPRRRALGVAGALGGGGLALLVGRDGTPGGQVARVLVVAAVSVLVLAGGARVRDRRRGSLAIAFGVLGIAIGLGFMPFVAEDPVSLTAMAGAVVLLAGLVLTVAGTVLVVRGRRLILKVATCFGAFVLTSVAAFVLGVSVAVTNVPHAAIGATPASRDLPYVDVSLTTSDGVRLAGWYVASTNQAAVVLLHGAGSTRSDVLNQAAVLARNGFGVLMIDARGHGDSAGRAMDFGWNGDADIAAATGYLAARPDVDPERIGLVGLSMGGEEAIGASAANAHVRAVVAEGATARTAADEAWLSDEFGIRGLLQEQLERLQDVVTDALTDATVPTAMRAAIESSGDTRYLVITAGEVADEGRAARYLAAGAPDRVDTWTVPEAAHTAGLRTDPDEWEARVITFLTELLGAG